jgi:hypothetical protein
MTRAVIRLASGDAYRMNMSTPILGIAEATA